MISELNRAQKKNFSLATLANFFFFCNFSSFFLLPLFIKDLGGDEATIGYIMGSFGVTSLGTIPLVAFLIDKYGRRKFMLLGGLLMFGASLSYLTITELSPLFYAFRLLQGVGFAFFFTSAGTFVADYVPKRIRAQGLGIFGAFTIASYAIGPSIGEAVIERFGFYPFFIYTASFSVVAIALVYFTRDADFERTATDPYGLNFFKLLVSKRYTLILLTNLILAGGLGSILNFIAAFLKSEGLDAFYFFLTYTVTVVSVRILGGTLSDRFGRKKVASPSLLLVAISLAAIVFIDSGFTAVLVSFLFSAGYGLLYPTLSALVIDKAGSDERGKAMGAFNACFSAGINFLAFPLGVIARDLSFEWMYVISGAFVFVGFLIFTLFEKE